MFKGSVASEDLGEVVRALKSAAEPTRLRLLFLLSHGGIHGRRALRACSARASLAFRATCGC